MVMGKIANKMGVLIVMILIPIFCAIDIGMTVSTQTVMGFPTLIRMVMAMIHLLSVD